MNEKHIALEEMTKLLYAEKLDAELLATAAGLNRHLMQCDSCMKSYQELLAIKELTDKERFQEAENHKDSAVITGAIGDLPAEDGPAFGDELLGH